MVYQNPMAGEYIRERLYSMGRHCSKCPKPIANHNKSGMCSQCLAEDSSRILREARARQKTNPKVRSVWAHDKLISKLKIFALVKTTPKTAEIIMTSQRMDILISTRKAMNKDLPRGHRYEIFEFVPYRKL